MQKIRNPRKLQQDLEHLMPKEERQKILFLINIATALATVAKENERKEIERDKYLADIVGDDPFIENKLLSAGETTVLRLVVSFLEEIKQRLQRVVNES